MHEAAVCNEIMDIALRAASQHGLQRITHIQIAAGPYSCINEQQLNFYFNVVQQGTCMEGAWISIDRDESLVGISQMFVKGIDGE